MNILYVSDLDGTLLNTKDRISEYSLNVINKLVEKGMLFTYATARSLSSASVVTNGLITNLPVIVYNGAFIINPLTKEIFSSNFFTFDQKNYIVDLLTKYKVYPLVYSYIDGVEKVSWLQSKENNGFKRYLNLRKGDKRLNPLSDITALYRGDIFYFTCIGEKEELLPIYNSLNGDPDYTCILQQELYCEEYWCEIMHKNSTKASAILKVKELTGCDKIISFGDALNDIPMFKISDECYAVNNAVTELKDIASGVIDSNDDDGVAMWLEAYCKLK